MTGQVIKKVVQKLKRPEEKWYFNATPEMFERFRYLLGLAPAFDYSQSKYFDALLFSEYYEEYPVEKHIRTDRETAWQKFQNEIELKFGRIDYDSCSTLATMDDIPGTGRLIDKFVYQPIGRSIERLFLNLELRYFHPPEKSACQIRQFLEGSVYFGNLIPVDKIKEHSFQSYNTFDNIVNFNEVCVSLFMEISRKEKIAKAFQRLLMQASSKHRSLRVEAQKQIWSLFRYENMVFILNVITDLESLTWDGYTTTFQHCSPLDPDFQTHFNFVGEMISEDEEALFDMQDTPSFGPLYNSMRDILETCARGNRGFSSLPINLVIKLLEEELYTFEDHEDQKLEDTEKFAENLYLALIAITGFCNEFSYASNLLSAQMRDQYIYRTFGAPFLLPLWGKDRTKSDINALELMVHFTINLIISIEHKFSELYSVHELEYYIALLNDADKGRGTMSKLEARASEDYLRKVTERVQRGPISFAMFKDIVTGPVIWEKYHRPEHHTEATDESRLSTTWKYGLRVHADQSLKSSILSFYYIPFSDSFRLEEFNTVVWRIQQVKVLGDYPRAVDSWFDIQKWLDELMADSMELTWDRPGTQLYEVMKWWCSYDIDKKMSPIVQEVRRPGNVAQPLPRNDGETTTLPSPCQCRICKRSSHMPEKEGTPPSIEEHSLALQTEDVSSQHSRQHNPATESSPLTSWSGFLKRKLEEEEPRPQIAPLPRRYRDNTAEDAEPGSSLGPVRKKQRTSLRIESDASDADAIITEVDDDSTESDTGSEDAMSLDEDFWSAKSKLSLLAIED